MYVTASLLRSLSLGTGEEYGFAEIPQWEYVFFKAHS
jgi:hypothetical protein